MKERRVEAVVIIGTGMISNPIDQHATINKRLNNIRSAVSSSPTMLLLEGSYGEEAHSLLKDKLLAPYARIIVVAHGAVFEDELYVDLGILIPINSIFKFFTSKTRSPLIFDITSCYSGNAISSLQYLNEGSILVTHARFNAPGTLEIAVKYVEDVILAMQYKLYHPFFPGNFTFAAATSLKVTSALPNKLLTAEFDPTLKQVLDSTTLKHQVETYTYGLKALWDALCARAKSLKETEQTQVLLCKRDLPSNFAITANTFTLPTFASLYADMYHMREYKSKTMLGKIAGVVMSIWEPFSLSISKEDWTGALTRKRQLNRLDDDVKEDTLIAALLTHCLVFRFYQWYYEFNVNKLLDCGSTLLHISAKAGHIEALSCLLATDGLDIHTVDNNNKTALHVALDSQQTQAAKTLISYTSPYTLDMQINGVSAIEYALYHEIDQGLVRDMVVKYCEISFPITECIGDIADAVAAFDINPCLPCSV